MANVARTGRLHDALTPHGHTTGYHQGGDRYGNRGGYGNAGGYESGQRDGSRYGAPSGTPYGSSSGAGQYRPGLSRQPGSFGHGPPANTAPVRPSTPPPNAEGDAEDEPVLRTDQVS